VHHLYQLHVVGIAPGMPSAVTSSLAELSDKVDELARALPATQSRVSHLEMAKAKLENRIVALSLSQDNLSVRVSALSSQLVTALNIVQALWNQTQVGTNGPFPTLDPIQTLNWKC
jgi:chromosome segregation ATPase